MGGRRWGVQVRESSSRLEKYSEIFEAGGLDLGGDTDVESPVVEKPGVKKPPIFSDKYSTSFAHHKEDVEDESSERAL